MIGSKTNKERERYYLFAGMGGSASRRKQRIFLVWSLAAGILISILVAVALLWVNRLRVG